MLSDNAGTPVHFPADPTKFVFDEEVAQIFPDMAARSIPHFLLGHKSHAKIVASSPALIGAESCRVLDIGASRGHFLQHLLAQNVPCRIDYTGVDYSAPMCKLLQEEFPDATVMHSDITSPEFNTWLSGEQFDVVCCNYVLQFLQPNTQMAALSRLLHAVKPGGLFFLGHKARHEGLLGEQAHELYIQWRMINGYTREEVEAKTAALKGSMFPMSHHAVMTMLRNTFSEVQETSRFMMFSTVAARK